jgi:hypothetical protein
MSDGETEQLFAEKPRLNQFEMPALSLRQRLTLRITGRVFLRYERRKGWLGSLPIYLAKCPVHGYFIDYPHGENDRLDCPQCFEELRSKLLYEF